MLRAPAPTPPLTTNEATTLSLGHYKGPLQAVSTPQPYTTGMKKKNHKMPVRRCPPLISFFLLSPHQEEPTFFFISTKKKKKKTFGSREANLNSIQWIGFYQSCFKANAGIRLSLSFFSSCSLFFFLSSRESTFDHMRWPYVPDQFILGEYGLSPDIYIYMYKRLVPSDQVDNPQHSFLFLFFKSR